MTNQASYQERLDEAETTSSVPRQAYSDEAGSDVDLMFTSDFYNPLKKEYKVIECQQKQYKKVHVLLDRMTGKTESIEGLAKEDIAQIKTFDGIVVIPRTKEYIRFTKICGGAVLEDEESDLYTSFTLIPDYAKKRGKKIWGKVEGMKDLQRELNKRRSQLADIINKCDAYGWFYDHQTFTSPESLNRFKRYSSTPGFVLEVESTDHPPVMREGVKFPSEIVNYEISSAQKMREIANINLELQGQATTRQSGIALAEKKRSAMTGNEFLFDNQSLAKRILARSLVSLIQKVYTPQRILRVIGEDFSAPGGTEPQIGGQPLSQHDPRELMSLLENEDLTKYDVVATEDLHTPTNRMLTFAIWSELARGGVPVPPQYLAEMSDAPNKDKLIAGIVQMQQAQASEADKKNQTEIIKTQIAHQGNGAM